MKKLKSVIVMLTLISMLTGCALPVLPIGGGNQDADATAVIVDKKGAITQIIVEGFEQPYYNADELRNEIDAKAKQYCSQAGDEEAIVLEDLTVSEEKQLKAKIKFASSKEYTAFNEKVLFVGTVSEAYSNGYTFSDMVGADGQSLSAQAVLEKGDMKVVVLEEAQQVITPSKIAYYSTGMNLMNEKTVMNLNDGQISFVIYE